MRAHRAATACVLVILLSACAPKVDAPADVQAIKEANTAWDKAWTDGDADALASLYADNAVAMPPNLPAVAGKDALRASSKKYFAQFKDENRSVVEDVRVSGNLAVAWGTQRDPDYAEGGWEPRPGQKQMDYGISASTGQVLENLVGNVQQRAAGA